MKVLTKTSIEFKYFKALRKTKLNFNLQIKLNKKRKDT